MRATRPPPLYPYAGSEAASGIGELLDAAPDIVFVDRIEGMLPVLGSHRRPPAVLLDIDDIGHKPDVIAHRAAETIQATMP